MIRTLITRIFKKLSLISLIRHILLLQMLSFSRNFFFKIYFAFANVVFLQFIVVFIEIFVFNEQTLKFFETWLFDIGVFFHMIDNRNFKIDIKIIFNFSIKNNKKNSISSITRLCDFFAKFSMKVVISLLILFFVFRIVNTIFCRSLISNKTIVFYQSFLTILQLTLKIFMFFNNAIFMFCNWKN